MLISELTLLKPAVTAEVAKGEDTLVGVSWGGM